MASIKVSDLNLDGSNLFIDSEGFMNDLGEDELAITKGGTSLLPAFIATTIYISLPDNP